MESVAAVVHREPWNKEKIAGQKAPFKPKDICALRASLQMENLRAVQLLLAQSETELTIRYLGFKVSDALEPFAQTEI